MPTQVPGIGVVDEKTGQVVDPTTTMAVTSTLPGGSGASSTTAPPATNTPGDYGAGMAPPWGWAAQQKYTPLGASMAYENPWYILKDVFPGMQGGESNPFFQGLRDLPFDPLALFTISQGSQAGTTEDASGFINWLQNMYKQQLTPGGQAPSSEELIRTIFNSGGGQKEGEQYNSLQAMLAAGGPSEQIRILFNLLRDSSSAGMNPMAARAYQSAVAQAGDKYGNAMMHADEKGTMDPTSWMNKNTPWLTMR